MKKNYFPVLIPVFGAVAMWLRWSLYRMAVDDRGLLEPFHLLEIRLWVLTAVVFAAVIWVIRSKQVMVTAPDWAAAAGCFVLSLAIAVNAGGASSDISVLRVLHQIFRWFACIVLIAMGLAWLRKKPALFGYSLVPAIFFGVHALNCYQSWSRDPQVMNYVFSLLACICLMLFSYQKGAGSVGIGSRKKKLFTGLMGSYLCFAAFPHGQWLYLAGGIWMLTNLERN